MQAKYEQMNYRLADKLADPKTLLEIVDEGIKNNELATNCFAELLEQLYRSDKVQTLVSIDSYNLLYRPSEYLSFRYENNKRLRGKIPPHDFALVRLLMKFDGHFMRNGVKLFATSHHDRFNHIMKPEDIDFYEGYHQRVANLPLNDFRNAMHYFTLTEWMPEAFDREWELETLFMETQGNWQAFKHSMLTYNKMHYSK